MSGGASLLMIGQVKPPIASSPRAMTFLLTPRTCRSLASHSRTHAHTHTHSYCHTQSQTVIHTHNVLMSHTHNVLMSHTHIMSLCHRCVCVCACVYRCTTTHAAVLRCKESRDQTRLNSSHPKYDSSCSDLSREREREREMN